MRTFCIFIFLCLTSTLLGGLVDDGLKQIPINDKFLMRHFFETNLRIHQAAHVIYFNNKPASLATAWTRSPKILYNDILWVKGWKAFKKHEHLFPHPDFIFIAEFDKEEADWKSLNLFIINKKSMITCLNKHAGIFREKLGQDFSSEQFVLQLENGKELTPLIKNDEMLLGILLGFGEESCRQYEYMRNSYKGEIPPHTSDYCPLDIKSPNMKKLFPVGFMGNPTSKEVRSLMSEYENELNIFWNMYKKSDPMSLFLKCICNEYSSI